MANTVGYHNYMFIKLKTLVNSIDNSYMLVIEQRKAQLSNQVHYVVSLHDCYLEKKSHST